MTAGNQAAAVRKQASGPQALKRQFVAFVHDPEHTRLSRSPLSRAWLWKLWRLCVRASQRI